MKTIAQQLNIKEFPFIINDSNGNKIYYEDSDGYWVKREFDKNGKRTYYENSTRYWAKSEFDENGNETYYEDSYGVVFAKQPESCEGRVVEIDGKKYQLKELK